MTDESQCDAYDLLVAVLVPAINKAVKRIVLLSSGMTEKWKKVSFTHCISISQGVIFMFQFNDS